jgi:hypothetical protein
LPELKLSFPHQEILGLWSIASLTALGDIVVHHQMAELVKVGCFHRAPS